MAITITHPSVMNLYLKFDGNYSMPLSGKDLDEATEIACDVMIEHNFHLATIKDIRDNLLVKIERS